MEYIKTKGGIYKIIEDLYFGRLLLSNKKIVLLSDEDVKVADAIEDLFDEYVLRITDYGGKYRQHRHFDSLSDALDYIADFKVRYMKGGEDFDPDDLKFEIYGAIWTDGGLIYAAKRIGEEGFKLL